MRSGRWSEVLRQGLLPVSGLGLLVAGLVAAFLNKAASASCTAMLGGTTLLLAYIFSDRLSSLSMGLSGVSIELTSILKEAGAPRIAQLIVRSGFGDLGDLASAYAFIHSELEGPEFRAARVRLQDRLVRRARDLTLLVKLPAAEARDTFRKGAPALRVLALGFMQGDPELADMPTVHAAIAQSRTANEQYHGLRLAELLLPRLDRAERQLLRNAIEGDGQLREAGLESKRGRLAKKLLDQLIALERSEMGSP